MPITTRSQANQFREKEFAILRGIDVDYTTVHTTPLPADPGVWESHEAPTTPPLKEDSDLDSVEEESWEGCRTPEPVRRREPYRAPTPYWIEPAEIVYVAPKPLPPATPSTPKVLGRTFTTGVVSETDMVLRVHVKKDEDVGKAIWRHVGMYMEESHKRELENKRRVYEFVKNRPHLLRELGEGTELFVRDSPSWDDDPFQ